MIKKMLFFCCFFVLFSTLSAVANVHVGQKIPVFNLKDLDNKLVDLGSVVGNKPIVLVFWATWANDCAPKLAEINAYYSKYGKDDIKFVGINIGMNDTEKKARAYVQKNEMMYPNVFDKTGELSQKYQLNKVFSIIVVSKDGTMMMRLNNVPMIDDSVLEMLNSYVRPSTEK